MLVGDTSQAFYTKGALNIFYFSKEVHVCEFYVYWQAFFNVFNFVMFTDDFIYKIFTQINGTTCDLLHVHFTRLLLLRRLVNGLARQKEKLARW